ncbi:AMP-binding protein [Novosphingobium mangrovi (ex Huang et al. 2023)]|uniref:AMP-binding protein n=1 Tax=Novosphingobium mangrovi (ex Huang et al. 2023) TaxID=2976432 RepID=A0ABT2I967_9SPHN|nr:AMP-binding protein [Novosphingobium mangrovi (ex Huang et al. 2023)]MCT2401329.1 AMP-binding protein [Novosphingobium mangrovi (ex Huang et al. 2023)]
MEERIGLEAWRERYAHPGEWEQEFPPLTMTGMFATSVARYGDRALVDFFGRTFTYRQFYFEASRFAAGLQSLGISRGDRIGLYLPNVPTYLSAYFGALMAGATLVNFSPLYTAAELEAQVADSGTRLLVTLDVPSLLPTAERVLHESALEWLVVARLAPQLPFWRGWALRLFGGSRTVPIPDAANVFEWSELLPERDPEPVAIDPLTDLALLQYTGGTTGTPKGAMLSHQNLTANARQIEEIDPHAHVRDVIMGVLPFFHVFANACVLNRTVLDGGTIAMLPRFHAGQTLATLQRVRATAMPGVPTMYRALLGDPKMYRTDFSSLFTCISGGAPLPAPVKMQFERASGAKLVEGYGLTEAAGVVSTNPFDGPERPGTIGHPLPGTDLRLLDKDDPSRDAAPDEPGELAVSGPQVMLGYWNRPEEGARIFVEREGRRWLRTGDIATIDEDGYVRIVDRSKDMIAVGGFKVFPSQVEERLLDHPAVKEAVVIGVPDAYHGEMPRAFVVVDPARPVEGEQIAYWLNMRVGKHERVDSVVLRTSLPRTMVGKPDRKALRAEVSGG